MDRRRLLRSLAGGGALALAGCLGERPGSGGGTDDPQSTPAESPTDTPTDDPEPTDTPAGTPTPTPSETPAPAPAVTDRSLSVTDSGCGGVADEADVSFADSTVTVRGTTYGNQACYTAQLDAATYDAGADELTIAVASVRTADEGQPCADCIAEIGYEARVTFDGGLPGSVMVVHVHGDTETTVATVDR